MKIIISFMVATVVFFSAFYGWFEHHSNQLAAQQNLPLISANAIKHANAARVVYQGLRVLRMDSKLAEKTVVELGYVNEVVEQIVKNKRDDALEIIKDTHNNFVGIVLAQWCEKNYCKKTGALILVELAATNILLVNKHNVSLLQKEKLEAEITKDVQQAKQWLYTNQQSIRESVERYMSRQ